MVESEAARTAFRVVLADDHPATLEGLARVGRDPQLELQASCTNLTDLAAALDAIAPDLLVSDFFFDTEPPGTILDVLAGRGGGGLRTLVLSSTVDVGPVRDALEAGIHGFLPKTTPQAELRAAAIKVAGGGTEYGAWAERLPDLLDQRRKRPQAPDLSTQELAVLHGLADGKSQQEIATELVVAPSTVKTYVGRLYDKLQPRSRTPHGLVAHAYQQGLVS